MLSNLIKLILVNITTVNLEGNILEVITFQKILIQIRATNYTIIPALKSLAESQNRSLINLVETVLLSCLTLCVVGLKKGILKSDKNKKGKNGI